MIEQWKNIIGYENYKISNHGRVMNVNTGKFMSQSIRNEYMRVGLYSKPKQKSFDVHRLVAEHFLPVPSTELIVAASKTKLKKVIVNHIDGNKTNNHVDNLEWSTYSDNSKHSYVIGRGKSNGEQHYNSKLVEEDIILIRQLYSDSNGLRGIYTELSNRFDVSDTTIKAIIERKSWKHI